MHDKALPIALAIALAYSLFPVAAFAEEPARAYAQAEAAQTIQQAAEQDESEEGDAEPEGETGKPSDPTPVYRLYNGGLSQHLYTTDQNEAWALSLHHGWKLEGTGWTAPSSGKAVYRLYNAGLSQHLYTTDLHEIEILTTQEGWVADNDAKPLFFSDENEEGVPSSGAAPVYRAYNEALGGKHFYTASYSEYLTLNKNGWDLEGKALFASEYESTEPVVLNTQINGSAITGTVISGTSFLFLPATADVSSVVLYPYQDGLPIDAATITNPETGEILNVAPGDSVDLAALGFDESGNTLTLQVTAPNGVVANLTVMKSANILTMFIVSDDPDSQGRSYIESDPAHKIKAGATMVLLEPDGTIRYGATEDADSITIKGRGNSTWVNTNKKPYQIKLEKKTDLLATGKKDNKAKSWNLLANSFDETLIHNSIAFGLASTLGLPFTPEYSPVDLYYDGEYRGSYLLTEKVEVASGRVDITNLDDANEKANDGVDLSTLPLASGVNKYGYEYHYVDGAKTPEDYSGGYLLEIDYSPKVDTDEIGWFRMGKGISDTYVIKSPEYTTKEESLYISELLGEALECLDNGGTHPTTGKTARDYFDFDSFAKMFLVEELCKNPDAYAGSTFLYKPAGESRFYAGPVWDFDCAFGIRVYQNGAEVTNGYAYHGFMSACRGINKKMLGIPEFQSLVATLYQSSVGPYVNDVLLSEENEGNTAKSITAFTDELAASQAMNQALHGLVGYHNTDYIAEPFETWKESLLYLTNYTRWRNNWLAKKMQLWLAGNASFENYNYVVNGVDYSLVFDYDYYRDNNPDIAGELVTFQDALNHFLNIGMNDGRQGSENFNLESYRLRYEDLRNVFGGHRALYYRHYCTDGFKEGRIAY